MIAMPRSMRRADRQVTGFADIADILSRCDTIRLGLHDAPYPYVVPLSFGFEAVDGAIALYFHGAKEGLKHELIAKNPHVCVEGDIFHRYAKTERSITTEFESFVGFGKAELVFGDEAARGLDLLLEHCGFGGFAYGRETLDVTWVYKIALDEFKAKRRFV
jgi:nitroimidazol reductase NimA-like FMN-containing flavoprotein (pyridoxamine 5'-phosphate oxidase superfamily)